MDSLAQLVQKLVPALSTYFPRLDVFCDRGVWTPTLVGTGVPGTFTYELNAGEYTRLGKFVLCTGRISYSAKPTAPTGNLNIAGLPFAADAAPSSVVGALTFVYFGGVTLNTGATQLGGWLTSGATAINLVQSGSGVGAAYLSAGGIGASADLIFAISYTLADS